MTDRQKFTDRLHHLYKDLSDRELLERQTHYQHQTLEKTKSINNIVITFLVINVIGAGLILLITQ